MDNPTYTPESGAMDLSHEAGAGGEGGLPHDVSQERGASTPINRSFQHDDSQGFMRHSSTEMLTGETKPPLIIDPNPGGLTYNPTATLNKDNLPPPSQDHPYPLKAATKAPKRRTLCRSSMVLNAILILGIVAGIILCACISVDSNLIYIGPVILGMSVFALCGKAFFTLFWEEDPIPQLNPYIARMEEYIGATKDPYGLQQPQTTSPPGYLGPMGTMELTYPRQEAFVYNYPTPQNT